MDSFTYIFSLVCSFFLINFLKIFVDKMLGKRIKSEHSHSNNDREHKNAVCLFVIPLQIKFLVLPVLNGLFVIVMR